jgi:diaminopimelate decarboxylase
MTRDARIHAMYGDVGGELAIAGRPASEWVAAAGGETPLFVYDRAIIADTVAGLRAALPAEVGIHYAMKANPLPALVEWMAKRVDGIDVASAGELRVAIAAGARHISFAGPGKRDAELQAAIEAGITINLESMGEFTRASAISQRIGVPLRAAVRVNPPFDLKASGMRMGGGAKPFGVDAEQVPALLAAIGDSGAEFQGFHVFAGSQNLSAAALIEAQSRTIDLVAELAARAPSPPAVVNLGGGFGVPYFPGDARLDVSAVGAALAEALDRRAPVLAGTRFVLELGRYLVADAGVYLTRVVDRKTSAGELFLVTDGGLHHQLAASGNFGTVVRRNYPVASATHFTEPSAGPVNIVGCLCTPLDRLADRVDFPVCGTGDLIAVFMAGAYGLTASPTAFLGHGSAGEILA